MAKRTTDRKMDSPILILALPLWDPSSSPRSGLPYGRPTLTVTVHDSKDFDSSFSLAFQMVHITVLFMCLETCCTVDTMINIFMYVF